MANDVTLCLAMASLIREGSCDSGRPNENYPIRDGEDKRRKINRIVR